MPLDAPIKRPNQVSATIPCLIINELEVVHTGLLCPEEFEERLGCLDHNSCLRSHLEKKQEIFPSVEIEIHRTDLYSDYSMTAITHLSLAKDVEFMTGTKAEDFRGDLSKTKIKPDRTGGVIISYLFKEEQPDAPCITKPKSYHSKTGVYSI